MAPDVLAKMRDTLAHRGPDDAGVVCWDGAGRIIEDKGVAAVGLGHRRLSIIDLTSAGHQPLSNEDSTIWITFNGEFYNFQECRGELLQKGHAFKSRTDTETLVHLYEEKGIEETLRSVNGMFAFALWDSTKKTMFIARDRIGKKPLYYALLPDGSLLFASEIKALLASGLIDTSRIDLAALVQFWTYGYVIGERTIYEQIRRLLPGHYGIWHDGQLTNTCYWDCPFGRDVMSNRSIDELADELESLLCDAIRMRLIADVPLGLFLSGGVDSSLIAALTAKVAGHDVESFTIAFGDRSFDESPFASAVSSHLGIRNSALKVDEDMIPYFGQIARQFDEPFGDSSAIPTYFVSKLAKERVTVAVTGDGGDELFAGYDSYAEGLRLWGDRQQREMFKRDIHGMERFWDLRSLLTPKPKRLTVWERSIGPIKRRRIFTDSTLRIVKDGTMLLMNRIS
jgi:asparagine synthase (glutamine-hydrolysing)